GGPVPPPPPPPAPPLPRLHLAVPGRGAERRPSRGGARTARDVGAHGIGEKRSAGVTLSRDAWFNMTVTMPRPAMCCCCTEARGTSPARGRAALVRRSCL